MLSDLIWAAATSYLVLGIIGAILIAALIVGYFPLLKWFPVIGEYVAVGKLVSLLAASALAFLVGTRLADERAEVKRLKIDLAYSQLQINAQKATADTAAALRAKAEEQNKTLEQKVSDYEDQLAKKPKGPEGCGCGFDADDIDSLRGIAR